MNMFVTFHVCFLLNPADVHFSAFLIYVKDVHVHRLSHYYLNLVHDDPTAPNKIRLFISKGLWWCLVCLYLHIYANKQADLFLFVNFIKENSRAHAVSG